MMLNRIRRWLRDPRFLLALAAALVAFAVQSGELGSADTQHRLQSTHSFWTTEPPVFPQEYPEFGVHGRGGRLESWYGIGQSLLMLPADILGTYVERIPLFANYNGNDPSVRNIIVSYTTNILLSVLTALICFRFLRQFDFKTSHAAAGVLALLCATTHLHYTQNMMENNYIFLLTLTGLSYEYEWVQNGSRRALLIGSVALGLNLLTRLTTGMDLLAAGFFVLLTLWLEQLRGRALWDTLADVSRNRCTGRRVFPATRPAVSIPPLRIVLQYLYKRGRPRSENAESGSARQLSLRCTLPRRLSRGALLPGEVDFPLRSFAHSHDPARRRALEALQPGAPGIYDRDGPPACLLTSASMRDTRCGAETRRGATGTSRQPSSWPRCLQFPCCSVTAPRREG